MKKNITHINQSEKLGKSVFRIICGNFFTLFNLFNALIALALILVEAWLNLAFLAIIILNATIGAVQEIRAKRLVGKLSLLTVPKARITRCGTEMSVPVEDILIDDILLLSAGGQVPADAEVLSGEPEVNESMLTGESESVARRAGEELLSGSYLTGGTARARVIRVGADKFSSRLMREAKKHKKPSSELTRSMNRVTRFTSFIIIPVAILLFVEARFLRGDTAANSVIFSSAALLGMLPKGLVLITTIALFSGVVKLSKKRVLVQQLQALETLARADVLCLDKTGTLTEGVMRVSDVVFGQELPDAEKLFCRFVTASEDNNATFAALKQHFQNAKFPSVTARVPFSSDKKWSGISFEDGSTVVLGAPETLNLPLPQAMQALQKAGRRILCAGFSSTPLEKTIPEGLTFLAAIALYDAVRKDAAETLAGFKREGVILKVISGDNPLTVSLTAKEAGLEGYDNFVDMSAVTFEQIPAAAQKYTVFGRVSPQQKKALVAALKSAGHVVAMTGDGVNDLPALREADCGIALAEGSEAARQAAELVLASNEFSVLPEIVLEGRRVMNNITRVAGVFFIKTIYSALLSILCIISNIPFPFIPIQITLIDAAVEAYPGFFLSFEPDKSRISGNFLLTVIRRAAPYALLIAFAAPLTSIFSSLAGVSSAESRTAVYCLTGLVSLIALFRSSRPLNSFRIFICATATAGFFAAAMLFGSLLELSLTPAAAAVFSAAAAASIVLLPLLIKLADKLIATPEK